MRLRRSSDRENPDSMLPFFTQRTLFLDILLQAGAERKKEEERVAAEAARAARIRGPAGQLADVLLKRGWKIGRPQFRIGTATSCLGAEVQIWLAAVEVRCILLWVSCM